MANSERGEVKIEAGGKAYVLRLGINALIEIQRELGVESEEELFKKFGAGSRKLETLRTCAWKGIRTDSGEPITEEQAGDLIDAVGLEAFPKKLQEALRLAMPATPGNGSSSGPGRGKARAGSPGAPS